jgi:hypothetical protein
MKRQRFHNILIKKAGFVFLLGASIALAENESPHTISKDSKSTVCTTCHKTDPELKANGVIETRNHPVDRDSFSQDGTTMCSTCHNPDDGHKVGLVLDFQAPVDLPLDKKNKMTCLTCHYTHGSLTSDRPQASVSFMDRLFNDARMHKSFLLRRNNSDGELCLTCHNVNQGSK